MEWLSFEGVSWLGVGVAFLVTFALGWYWYSDAGFFKIWQRAGNITREDMEKANMGAAFGGTAAGNLLGIILLAVLMVGLGVSGVGPGAALGAVLGLVFRAGAHALHNGFAIRKPVITLIDGAHDTVALAVAGAVLGIWM